MARRVWVGNGQDAAAAEPGWARGRDALPPVRKGEELRAGTQTGWDGKEAKKREAFPKPDAGTEVRNEEEEKS